MSESKLLSALKQEEDEELSLRPQKLSEYVGQKDLKENLDVFMKAAKQRDEALDHVFLIGPPGIGKTAIMEQIAEELGLEAKGRRGTTQDERSGRNGRDRPQVDARRVRGRRLRGASRAASERPAVRNRRDG